MPLTQESAARKDRTSGIGEMQHRHFATVAAIIRDMNDPLITAKIKNTIARKFADDLAFSNVRFDRARFLAACGV